MLAHCVVTYVYRGLMILLSSYFDHKSVLLCSTSVEKYPGNKMLGWRKFVDGKVSIYMQAIKEVSAFSIEKL